MWLSSPFRLHKASVTRCLHSRNRLAIELTTLLISKNNVIVFRYGCRYENPKEELILSTLGLPVAGLGEPRSRGHRLMARANGQAKLWGFTLGAFGVLALVFAVLGVAFGFGAGDDALVAGPEVVVATPDIGEFSNPAGTTSVTITQVDNSLNQVVWNTGSAAILVGIAAFLFGFAIVFLKSNQTELFSSESSDRLAISSFASFVLIMGGGLARFVVEGRIIDASGLIEVDASDDDFSLFIFDLPFVALIFISQIFSWLWQRAASIESDLEEVV